MVQIQTHTETSLSLLDVPDLSQQRSGAERQEQSGVVALGRPTRSEGLMLVSVQKKHNVTLLSESAPQQTHK